MGLLQFYVGERSDHKGEINYQSKENFEGVSFLRVK